MEQMEKKKFISLISLISIIGVLSGIVFGTYQCCNILLKDSHKAEIERIKSNYDDKLRKLKREHEKEIKKKNEECLFKKSYSNIGEEEKCKNELSHAKNEYFKKIKLLESDNERRINEIIAKYEAQVNDIKKNSINIPTNQSRNSLSIDKIVVKSIDSNLTRDHYSQKIDAKNCIGFSVLNGIPMFEKFLNKGPIICSMPPRKKQPAVFEIAVNEKLFCFKVHPHPLGDSMIEIWAGNKMLLGENIIQQRWHEFKVPIPDNVNRIELRHVATGWYFEFLYFDFLLQKEF